MSESCLESLRGLAQRARVANTVELQVGVRQDLSEVLLSMGRDIAITDIAEALGIEVAVNKRRRSSSLDVSRALRDLMPPIIDFEDGGESGFDFDYCDSVFVNPDPRFVPGVGEGDGDGFSREIFPRIKLIARVLEGLGIALNTLPKPLKGDVRDDMVRGTPYVAIAIPVLGKTILVCEEAGNDTFVIDGIVNDPEFLKLSKTVLKSLDGVAYFSWCEPALWCERLEQFLLNKESRQNVGVEDVEFDSIGPMDAAYFSKKENVKADLLAYAKGWRGGIRLDELTTKVLLDSRVRCRNGEMVRGKTYMNRAGVALGLASNTREASTMFAKILRVLLRSVDIEVEQYAPMDEAYFSDKEKVLADLKGFAVANGVRVEALTTHILKNSSKIKCSNGEMVSGSAYMGRAGIALGLASNAQAAGRILGKILVELFKKADIQIEEFPVMDAEYFRKVENLKYDLEAFAKAAGKKSVKALTANSMRSLQVKCSNGEVVSSKIYLFRAASAFSLASAAREAYSKLPAILECLKAKIGVEGGGFPMMDAEYFKDNEKVKKDLSAYAELSNVLLKDLHVRAFLYKRVKCQNGENVLGATYLNRAAVALVMASNHKVAETMYSAVLIRLLKDLEVDLDEYSEMDSEYFSDSGRMQFDLDAFMTACGGLKSYDELSVYRLRSVRARCANGELLVWTTFLSRAAKALELVEKVSVERGLRDVALRRLIEVAGKK